MAQGDVCTTIIRGTKSNNTLSFCVKDSMVADNISDICELTSEENYHNLRNYLLNVDKYNLIDEQGNINNSFRDVPSKVIFIKIDIMKMTKCINFIAQTLSCIVWTGTIISSDISSLKIMIKPV